MEVPEAKPSLSFSLKTLRLLKFSLLTCTISFSHFIHHSLSQGSLYDLVCVSAERWWSCNATWSSLFWLLYRSPRLHFPKDRNLTRTILSFFLPCLSSFCKKKKKLIHFSLSRPCSSLILPLPSHFPLSPPLCAPSEVPRLQWPAVWINNGGCRITFQKNHLSRYCVTKGCAFSWLSQ